MKGEKLDLLVFAAHPDDAEIGMGGTMIKATAAGRKVAVCDLTLAEMSSNGDVETRQREAAAAAEEIGLYARYNLRFPDRGLKKTAEQLDAVVALIRQTRPDVVAAPYWQDRHPDHVACSELVQEAVFSAKLRRYKAEWPVWTVPHLYFYLINDFREPDFLVDITDVQARKMRALSKYQSQFEFAPDRAATPLNQGYLERVAARDRFLGGMRMVSFAEGFVRREPLMLASLWEEKT